MKMFRFLIALAASAAALTAEDLSAESVNREKSPNTRPAAAARPQDKSPEELTQIMEEYASRPDAYSEAYRPQFHFSPMTGWMNDPNGLVYYDGEYHLYFQAWPQDVRAGGKIWSHAVSPDLVHWKQIEHALLNEGPRQIFSGSAVIDHNNTAGFQTGDEKTLVAVYTLTNPSVQCIAYSNDRGRTFTKIKEPVVETINANNRDPRVFWHEPTRKWVMILYLAKPSAFALMGSNDLKEWTNLSDVTIPGGNECPESFELAVDGDKTNTRWVAWSASGIHRIGQFDGVTFTPDAPDPLPSEWGSCCYAGQTWNDTPDGRRIFIGWMRSKAGRQIAADVYEGMPFTQQMTVPRELSLRSTDDGPRLFAMPVKELDTLRREGRRWSNLALKAGMNPLSEIAGDLFDIEMEVEIGAAQSLTLDISGTPIVYDAAARQLSCLGKSVEAPPIAGRLKLRVLVDRTSIEIFINEGRYVMSFCFRPDAANRRFSLTASGGDARIHSLHVWPLSSIWMQKGS